MFVGKKVLRDGKEWCSVTEAARYLHTSQQQVRNMMGSELDYMQIRKNAQPYVALADLVKVQVARLNAPGRRQRSRRPSGG